MAKNRYSSIVCRASLISAITEQANTTTFDAFGEKYCYLNYTNNFNVVNHLDAKLGVVTENSVKNQNGHVTKSYKIDQNQGFLTRRTISDIVDREMLKMLQKYFNNDVIAETYLLCDKRKFSTEKEAFNSFLIEMYNVMVQPVDKPNQDTDTQNEYARSYGTKLKQYEFHQIMLLKLECTLNIIQGMCFLNMFILNHQI